LTIYVIDTSSLITAKFFYPPENVKPFWDLLHQLNINKKLHIIKRVKNEIKDDYLKNVFLKQKIISNENIQEVVDEMQDIVNNIPRSSVVGFESMLAKADPWIIAYAKYLQNHFLEVYVITGELQSGNKIRIPMICNKISIKNERIHFLMTNENLKLSKI